MRIDAEDCSPLEEVVDANGVLWLSRVAKFFDTKQHVLSFGRSRDSDEPVVSCDWDGTWRTGRYIGALHFEGGTLHIRPRLGLNTIRKWLRHVNNLHFVETPGLQKEDDSFIPALVAQVWAQSLAQAARHGLPALQTDIHHVGQNVRGRLEVAQTVARGSLYRKELVSVRRQRSLDNPIACTIVRAYGVLRRWIGVGRDGEWLSPRCQELLPQLLGATGPRPELPSKAELDRIRYTPITRSYHRFVNLSWQIARQRGLFGEPENAGQSNGILLDVAELWELYVLSVLRAAVHPLQVLHGTQEVEGRGYLLINASDDSRLGELRPDAVILGETGQRVVLDAKYKSLDRGPLREDLYQMAAYLSHLRDGSIARGALIYPEDPLQSVIPWPESKNPWQMGRTGVVSLLTLPHDANAAVVKLRAVLEQSHPNRRISRDPPLSY